MSQSWEDENLYIFPPVAMLGRILQKVEAERATVTIIAPYWPAQPWFPKLLGMSIAPPLLLPQEQQRSLFQHPMMLEVPDPAWLTLAWRVSGKSFKRRSMAPPSMRRSRHGSLELSAITALTGPDGWVSATQMDNLHLLSTTLRLPIGWANW